MAMNVSRPIRRLLRSRRLAKNVGVRQLSSTTQSVVVAKHKASFVGPKTTAQFKDSLGNSHHWLVEKPEGSTKTATQDWMCDGGSKVPKQAHHWHIVLKRTFEAAVASPFDSNALEVVVLSIGGDLCPQHNPAESLVSFHSSSTQQSPKTGQREATCNQ